MRESVILMSDNATVVAYVNKQEGTVSPVICDLAQEILTWAELFMIYLNTRYVPGEKNVLTFQLSRPDLVLPTEWFLLPQMFDTVPSARSMDVYSSFSLP